MSMMNGMQVVIVSTPQTKDRTWKERFFSRPWRPWQKIVTVEHPMWDAVKDGDCIATMDCIYMTQAQFNSIKALSEVNTHMWEPEVTFPDYPRIPSYIK